MNTKEESPLYIVINYYFSSEYISFKRIKQHATYYYIKWIAFTFKFN